jgi:hypothetical protein
MRAPFVASGTKATQQGSSFHELIDLNARTNSNVISLSNLFNVEEKIFQHNESIQVSFDLNLI